MNPAYEAWNRLLADRFFRRDCAGRPVYLSVDDEELEELAPKARVATEVAAESLADSVKREFIFSQTTGLYGRFFRATLEWRAAPEEKPPPYIAMLAVAVLAGSRMAGDPSQRVASHNYYRRYNELFGWDPDSGQPAGFDELRRLWKDLDRWLEEDRSGRLGTSTVPEDPFPAHVGYPISQCLLRDSDRRRLTEFFRSIGLKPGDEITPSELFTYLRSWANPGCGLSDPAVRVIAGASGSVAEEIAEIAHAELSGWSGEVLDEQGRRRGELALVLEVKQAGTWVRAKFWARRPEGFPAVTEVRTRSGERVGLTALAREWYGPVELPLRNQDLRDGVVLEGDEYSFAYAGGRVIPLRASDEIGSWVSVRQVTATEPHCVIVHASLLEPVRRFLSTHAESWQEAPGGGNLPQGWQVLRNVRITSPASPPEPFLKPLAPRFGTATSFEGGLRIRGRLYLTAGEPDLWITVAPGDEPEVTVDGEPAALAGPISRIRLSAHELPAGDHRVSIGGLTRSFSSFQGVELPSASGSGSLAHILSKGRGYAPRQAGPETVPPGEQPRGIVRVSGASVISSPSDLPEPPAPPVLLPAGFRSHLVLGRHPGEVLETSPPAQPRWLARIGIEGQFQYFDQPVDFEAQWLLAVGSSGTQVSAIGRPPLPPELRDGADPELTERWLSAIAAGAEGFCRDEDRAAFSQYITFADQLRVQA